MKRTSKQTPVSELPANAVTVQQYAVETGHPVGYIYTKYNRSLEGKATANYRIVSFQNVNFVIPN